MSTAVVAAGTVREISSSRQVLQSAGLGTLLMDLLSSAEDSVYETRFDIDLLNTGGKCAGLDDVVIELNRQAFERLKVNKHLAIVPGATHLFEEPGTLQKAAGLASKWFHPTPRPQKVRLADGACLFFKVGT